MAIRRGTTGNDTLLGTVDADTLLGLAGKDNLRGGKGNDLLDGGSGFDQLRGEAGDDRLVFDRDDSLNDGGFGRDTLIINGAGVALNTAALAHVRGIEVIDLRGSGANQFAIDATLANRLSDTDTLRIRAGADDLIIAHGGWQAGANTTVDGIAYSQFALAGATLQIELAAHTLVNGVLPLAGVTSGDGYRLDGTAENNFTGYGVSGIGDFNGDGLDDFVIGAFGADPPAGSNAGASYVVFGRNSAPALSISLASLDGSNGFRIDGEAAGGFSGLSVHGAGDVNGDGRDDLIVGAPFASPGAVNLAGSSYVVLGQSSSTAVVDLATLDESQGYRLDGSGVTHRSGAAVSNAGDMNGDGFDDVLVGAYGAGPGAAYVVFGGPEPVAAPVPLASLGGGNVFRLDGVDGHSLTGKALAGGGDVNGDRIADIVISASDGSGRNYVVFGHREAFSDSQSLASLDGHNGFRIDGVDLNEGSGRSVGIAGDINGDGVDDLLIGVNHATPSAGATYVVFGHRGDFAATLALNALDGSNGFRINGVTLEDYSGRAVSGAGDVNGDGYDDILIGADRADPNGEQNSGSSYVVFGHGGSFAATFALASLNGSNGLRIDGALADDSSGSALASAGDVNGDGYADILVSASRDDTTQPNAGSTTLLYGRDFSGAVTRQGGAGNDVFTGSAAAESFLGGRGNDTLDGVGGADVLRGGAGNDVLVWNRDARVLDGGSGSDTLRVASGGANLSLALPRLSSIETIDLRAAGSQTVALDALDVLRLTDAPHLMTVLGDASDLVNLGGLWQNAGQVLTGFTRYTHGEAKLDVSSAVRVLTDNSITLAELDGTNGVHVQNSGLISTVVAGGGDINGDGFDDLLIGSDYSSAIGVNNGGLAHVVFGHGGGFTASVDVTTLGSAGGTRVDGLLGSGNLGASVSAAGDVNGDGLADFLLGADNGGAYLLFGRQGGFPTPLDLGNLGDRQGQHLAAANEFFVDGTPVSRAGDVNGDGYDDVIIGTSGGGARILFGHEGAFSSDLSLATLDGRNGFSASLSNFSSGRAVGAAGDVNGDGYDDFVVGAAAAAPQGHAGAGSSFVVFGHGGPFDPSLELGALNGEDGFRLDGVTVNDFSGTSVSGAGDVNGDGFADLLITAESADPDARNGAGSSYVVFGHGGAFNAAVDLGALDGHDGFRLDGGAANDRSGSAASAAGDINGDGYDDIVIGAMQTNQAGAYSGAAYVVFGHAGGFDARLNLATADGAQVLRLLGDGGSFTGSSVSGAGDVNGDGFKDVFIGGSNNQGGFVVFGRDFNGVVTRQGGSGNDTLIGTLAADALIGGLGNDVIDGLGGADALAGGAGDDTFILRDGLRRIDGGGGSDRLRVTGAQTLFALQATSAAMAQGIDVIDLNGSGNNGLEAALRGVTAVSDANVVRVEGGVGDFVIATQDNWSRADGAPQSINGQLYARYTSGPATLLIDTDVTVFQGSERAPLAVTASAQFGGALRLGTARNDVLNGTAAANTLRGLAGDDKLNGLAGNDLLEGGIGRDTLTGGTGNDKLDGGLGRDLLRGEAGNDTYVIDDANEIAKGTLDFGIDTVIASVSYVLGAQQENLTLAAGKLNLNATGNGGANILNGNSGANTLDGGAGRDTLLAGAGNDRLVFDRNDVRESGGSGVDTLIVNGAGLALGQASLKQVEQVEIFDLRGSGANRLAIDALLADRLSDSTTLRVRADANDTLFMHGGWNANGTTVIDTVTYSVFQLGAVSLQVESVAQQVLNGGLSLAALDGANGFRLDGVSPNHATGRSVSGVGDVNGDGFADFMLGAIHASPGAVAEAGTSHLVFGRSAALGATVDLADVGADVKLEFNSTVAGDRSGWALSAAGDFDGDGLGDFVIGAYSNGATSYTGNAYVVLGKSLAGAGVSTALDGLDGSNGFHIGGQHALDTLGFAVAGAGDINGDGFDDLIIGAYGYDVSGGYSGATYVIFGHAGASLQTLALDTLDGHNGFRIEGAGQGDRSGHAVAVGDFNGDGFADVIIGGNFANGSEHYSGAAFVVFGHDGDFVNVESLGGNTVQRIDGAAASDYAGFTVASAGDVNGDGYDDVIIGATGVDATANTAGGAAYVVFGHAEPFTTFNLGAIDGSNGFRIDGAVADKQLGLAVSGGGDVNGDGFADLVIGAPQADVGAEVGAGASYVLFGHAGSFATSIATGDLNGSNGLRLTGVTAGDQSGTAVSIAGDVDGDGYDDLLVGASAASNGAGPGNGSAYVIYGRDFTGAVAWQGSANADALNGDGSDETLVGGLGDDSLDGGRGRDVLRGGAGNDVLVWDREDRLADGGGGSDTLRIARGGADLTEGGPALRGIERIDLSAAGSNSLTLNATAVRTLGDQPRLIVEGDSADFVNLHGLWTQRGEQLAGHVRYTSQGAVVDIASSVAVVNNGLIALTQLDSRLGLTLVGAAAGDETGISVAAAGDVNGDGFGDFIIGADYADNNARSDSGSSYVVFGAANGLAPDLALASLNGSNGFRVDGASAGDQSGRLLAGAGDVNGNGFDDLLVGHRGNGVQQLLFGHGGTFAASVDLATLPAAGGVVMSVDGVSSVSNAGDFNGDGFDDFVVGANFANPPGNGDGASYLVFGSHDGLPAALTLNALEAQQGVRINGFAQNLSGSSVAGGGDFNGDGYDDVLIGAPQAAVGNEVRGASFVVFGQGTPPVAPLALDSLDAGRVLHINGANTNDASGRRLSYVGDINGDGLDDVLVSSPAASPHGAGSGSSYVLFGTRTPFSAAFNLADINGHNGFRLDGSAANDFATSVAGVGDVNADGFDDLLIGTSDAGNGRAYLVFGHAGDFEALSELGFLDGQQGLRLEGAAAFSYAGASVSAAGDIDGDGYADFLIGAPGDGSGPGAAYVIHGRDFTGGVTQQGGIGNDSITGGGADEIFVGGQGNDALDGAGGADVLIGGAGDDVLVWHGGLRSLDGGSGSDTLRVVASDVVLDFTQAQTPRVQGIDVINLTGSGNNLLKLDVADVLHISDHNALRIDGNAGDVLLSAGQGWQPAGGAPVTVGTQQYLHYSFGGAALLVDTDISQVVS